MHAQRLQAIAQAGIAYTTNAYDRERYEEIRGISVDLLVEMTDEPREKIIRSSPPSPDTRRRRWMFGRYCLGDNEILLVKEKTTRESGRCLAVGPTLAIHRLRWP